MPQLKIAIIGAGVAGATLAQALFKLPHLDVHVYESAPALKEGGHAVGLSINAQRALARLGSEFKSAPARAGGVDSNASTILLGEGPHAGHILGDIGSEKKYPDGVFEIIVIRSQFLEAIMEGAPNDRFHTGKKVKRLDSLENGQVQINFVDGEMSTFDAVIGADGIRGSIRTHVLGEQDPATQPVFGGFWYAFALAPIQKAIEELGNKYVNPDDNVQHLWIGQGRFILHDITGGKKTAQVITGAHTSESWPEDEWKKTTTKKDLASLLAPMTLGSRIVALFENDSEIPMLPCFEHLPAHTYCSDNVALIGDAAHAMTPWQASGAGTTIEDVLFLSTLLRDAKSIRDVTAAFQVYDQVRRPRTQAITVSSKEVGLTMTGQNKEVGLDPEKIEKYLRHRWDFIHEYDIDSELSQAMDQYHMRR